MYNSVVLFGRINRFSYSMHKIRIARLRKGVFERVDTKNSQHRSFARIQKLDRGVGRRRRRASSVHTITL